MSQEKGLVPGDEFVLRRIHKNHVVAGFPIVVGFTAFRPTPEDINGLSVFREKQVAPVELPATGRKPGEYFVARLAVSAILSLGLTVVADEQEDGPPGHALIPELTLEECKRDKLRLREIQVRLAELASMSIVYSSVKMPPYPY